MDMMIAGVILIIAAAFDYWTRKIPNVFIIVCYILGITYMTITNGWSTFYIYIIRALWPVLALFILYISKALGAGDIKLFSVISIFCPTKFFVIFVLVSLICAALYGVIHLLIIGEFKMKILSISNYIMTCVNTRKIEKYCITKSSYFCFSICMMISFVLCKLFELVGIM